MWQKKIYKYSLIKSPLKLNKKYKLIFGNYGIKSLNCGLVTGKHLENLRRKLSKQFKKLNDINRSKLFCRLHIWKGYTTKPMLSRMGKGAGLISRWMSFVRRGFILFEMLTAESFLIVLKIFQKAIISFPLKLLLIEKRV